MATAGDTSATPCGAYLKLAHGYSAAHPDGIVSYTAHDLPHVCASLLIASGASDVQVAHQMGHSKIETTKNIYTAARPAPTPKRTGATAPATSQAPKATGSSATTSQQLSWSKTSTAR